MCVCVCVYHPLLPSPLNLRWGSYPDKRVDLNFRCSTWTLLNEWMTLKEPIRPWEQEKGFAWKLNHCYSDKEKKERENLYVLAGILGQDKVFILLVFGQQIPKIFSLLCFKADKSRKSLHLKSFNHRMFGLLCFVNDLNDESIIKIVVEKFSVSWQLS